MLEIYISGLVWKQPAYSYNLGDHIWWAH